MSGDACVAHGRDNGYAATEQGARATFPATSQFAALQNLYLPLDHRPIVLD